MGKERLRKNASLPSLIAYLKLEWLTHTLHDAQGYVRAPKSSMRIGILLKIFYNHISLDTSIFRLISI